MNDQWTIIVAIISAAAAYTASVATLAFWLSGKFQYLEKTIYREMDKHRREDDEQFHKHGTRIQRLELKEFGFTQTGK